MLSEKNKILITGGTGSFGKAFLKKILKLYPKIERIVIFSRDEYKQWKLQQEFPNDIYPQIRFFIGDIRDGDRLRRALKQIDTVVHAAALKQVPAAEYNPMEFVKTNVIGAQNLIEACLDSEVENVVALSTDKAAAPINLYGATKLCSDKLFIAANQYVGKPNRRQLIFSVVRYGNVMGSRGSVIPLFMELAKKGEIPITDPNMTRFNITLNEGVELVLWALINAKGSEIFVPKIPSYKVIDVANAIAPNCKKKIIGIRSGEKMHEEMITSGDSFTTVDLGPYYSILPSFRFRTAVGDCTMESYLSSTGGKLAREKFIYTSETNKDFLSVNQLRELIKINIDNDFKPI